MRSADEELPLDNEDDLDDLVEAYARECDAMGFCVGSGAFALSLCLALCLTPTPASPTRLAVQVTLAAVGILSAAWFLLVWNRARDRRVTLVKNIRRGIKVGPVVARIRERQAAQGLPRIGPDGRIS